MTAETKVFSDYCDHSVSRIVAIIVMKNIIINQNAVCHCLIRSAIPGIFLFYSDHGSYIKPGSGKDCPTFCRRIKTIAVMVEIMVLITILWDPAFTLISDDTNKPPVSCDLRHWKR